MIVNSVIAGDERRSAERRTGLISDGWRRLARLLRPAPGQAGTGSAADPSTAGGAAIVGFK